MKRLITCLSVTLALIFSSNLSFAQGTQSAGIVMIVKSGTLNATFLENDCSWYGTSGWGGSVTDDICAPLVWADDLDGGGIDSLNCDSVPAGKYAGKVVLIRRGACEFGLKALNAEKAGAVAVIILNHFSGASDNGCTMINMGAGARGAEVTIPAVSGGRDFGNQLDNALKAGPVEICFSLPRVQNATFPYHYATPVSQVQPLDYLTFQYINRSADVQTDIVAKVDVKEPGGNVVSLSVPIDEVQPGADTTIQFARYTPPAVAGTFEAVFSNNKYTETRDSLRRTMIQTDYTFGTDNFEIDPQGVGTSNADFITAGLFIQHGSLYFTGANGGEATYATFGLWNVDSIYIPSDPTAGQFTVFLYDADVDGDGTTNLESSFEGDLSDAIVGQTTYQMTGNENPDSLFSVGIYDYNDPNKLGVTLKPNHAYYLSVAYDGSTAGTGRCPRFSNTLDEYYLPGFFSTPLQIGTDIFSGWSGAEVITRMQLQGYNPTTAVKPNILAKEKMQVTPNPANEFMRLNIALNEVSPSVGVTLIDGQGRSVRSLVQRNFQNGTIELQTKDLPSGTYLVWVRTAEGARVEKVAICH